MITPFLLPRSQGCGCYNRKCSFNILNGPEGRGQATPKTAPPCASRTIILNQVQTGHRKPTINPNYTTQLPQGQNPQTLQGCSATLLTSAHLISCVGGVTTSCNHISFCPAVVSSITPAYSASLTDMPHL